MATVQVYTITGRKGDSITLPSELFGKVINPRLLAQAARVYQWRHYPSRGKTKTRGEIAATTAKWYRQKGTGRARHGAKSAPIFVGGGIAHGPSGVRRTLTLPKKLAKSAFVSALSARAKTKSLKIIDAKASGAKTKSVVSLFNKLGIRGRTLVLYGQDPAFVQAARNMQDVGLIPARAATAYEVLSFPNLLVTRSGLDALIGRFGRKEKD